MSLVWGLLGPGALPNERRTRTLGVAASVRRFNELAVPGVGSVWFGKQLLYATLGIRIADMAWAQDKSITNIEAANAVEALACWLTFDMESPDVDPRLRGRIKLQGKTDLSFKAVRQRRFYVTQPMRMGTVRALPALGLVSADSSRFNAFACTNAAELFLDASLEGHAPYNRGVINHLACWAASQEDRVTSRELYRALSPLTPLPLPARKLLRERLVQGSASENADDRQRRLDVLSWVESIRLAGTAQLTWDTRPQQIQSEAHWQDMRAGALFLSVRDAAISVLDALERHIVEAGDGRRFSIHAPVPADVTLRLASLRQAANNFLAARHSDAEANEFCGECNSEDPTRVLQALVKRDGRVLRPSGPDILLSPSFGRSTAQQSSSDDTVESGDVAQAVNGRISWPPGISFRVENMFLLNADLQGELNSWLQRAASKDEKDKQ